MKRCEFHVGDDNVPGNVYQCPNKAKYITPKGPLDGKKRRVCGVHKNSVDKMFIRLGKKERCKELI